MQIFSGKLVFFVEASSFVVLTLFREFVNIFRIDVSANVSQNSYNLLEKLVLEVLPPVK